MKVKGWKCFDIDHDKAVVLACKFFNNQGFKTLLTKSIYHNGPDITIHDDYDSYTVEVKPVKKREKFFSFRTAHIEDKQRKYDLIAVVFPNGYVFVESMSDFLKSANKRGHRSFTYLVPKTKKSINGVKPWRV